MHTIRLRDPWHIQPLEDPVGHFQCVRHFHKPTGLNGDERVWLVIEGGSGLARVAFNGTVLGEPTRQPSGPSSCRWDVTSFLAPRNLVAIEVVCPADRDVSACLGAVRLEIE